MRIGNQTDTFSSNFPGIFSRRFPERSIR